MRKTDRLITDRCEGKTEHTKTIYFLSSYVGQSRQGTTYSHTRIHTHTQPRQPPSGKRYKDRF